MYEPKNPGAVVQQLHLIHVLPPIPNTAPLVEHFPSALYLLTVLLWSAAPVVVYLKLLIKIRSELRGFQDLSRGFFRFE